MKKVDIYNKDIKKQLLAASMDKRYSFLLKGGLLRGAVINSHKMVNEMRANHGLGILETMILGHSYIAAGLLSANLKGNDRIRIDLKCSGPVKGLSVESNAKGEVRGFLKTGVIPLDKPLDDFDMSEFIGAGFLDITKYIEDAKQPYTGQVMVEYGNLAQDLAHYFNTSEQTPTSFSLSVKYNSKGDVIGAGGLFIQAMPGADQDIISKIDSVVESLPSIGDAFSKQIDPEAFVAEAFKGFGVKMLDNRRVEFYCRCDEKTMTSYMSMLPDSEIKSLLEEGVFPVEVTCHNCATMYAFTEQEIRGLK